MAASLDALLNIKANVTGEGPIKSMGTAIGGIKDKAGAASSGLQSLTGAAGMNGLAGAMGALTPLLTVSGLTLMAKDAIDTGDALGKMATKTGISVENLSRFKQSADLGGSSLEEFGKAALKLNQGLTDAASTGKGPAAEALAKLGISATDATGKLKATDAVILEVADKFKAMPDGAEKSALAMDLFGRAGANLVPMLNGGAEAITGLNATMTNEFARAAEAFNDKVTILQTKLMAAGVEIGTMLMPILNGLTDALTWAADAFGSLPEPVQNVIAAVSLLTIGFVALAPAISAAVSLVGGIVAALTGGAGLAAAAASVGTALAGVGTVLATLGTAIAAFITWPAALAAALVAAIAAIWIFRDDIARFFSEVGRMVADLVASMWKWTEPIREVWMAAAGAILDAFKWAFDAIWALTYQVFLAPWVNLWENQLKEPVSAAWEWISGKFAEVAGAFDAYVVTPIRSAWEALVQMLPDAMNAAAQAVVSVWNSIIGTIRSIVNGAMNAIGSAINSVISAVNNVISGFNKLPGPDIGLIPKVSVPQFAAGGFVDGPTVAMIGDNRSGREYVIPEEKAAGFASNYLAGARGAAAIPSSTSGSSSAAPGPVNITTGPVMELDGSRYVKLEDLERAVQQTQRQILATLRTPGGRRAIGVA